MLSGRPSRSVDVAAAQLIAREAGAQRRVRRRRARRRAPRPRRPFEIVAALDEEMLGTLLEVQREAAARVSGARVARRLGPRRARRDHPDRRTSRGCPATTRAPTRLYEPREVDAACARALAAAADYAGLGEVESPPRPSSIDRREWARTALAGLSEAARPDRGTRRGRPRPARPTRRARPPRRRGGDRGRGGARRRLRGQARARPVRRRAVRARAARAPAVRGREPRDGAAHASRPTATLFLLWVALHECTHVIQFERVDWLVPHLRALASQLIEGAAEGFDAAALGRFGRRLLREPARCARAALRGELARDARRPERTAKRSTGSRRRCR